MPGHPDPDTNPLMLSPGIVAQIEEIQRSDWCFDYNYGVLNESIIKYLFLKTVIYNPI